MAAELYAADGRLDRAADELIRLRGRANADPWTHSIARDTKLLEASVRADWAARLIGHDQKEAARAQLAQAKRLYEEGGGPGNRQLDDSLYRLGSLYHQLGDTYEAHVLLTRYLAVDPTGVHAEAARRLLASSAAPIER
jgi:hypothetical protein